MVWFHLRVDDELPLDFEFQTDDVGLGADERAALEREQRLFRIERLREAHGLQTRAPSRPYVARQPCKSCGGTDARIRKVNGQNTVTCATCNLHIYNAPKHETGEAPRTVQTLRASVGPRRQALVLDLDGGRCVLCGSTESLTIGHLLSVADGGAVGLTKDEINSTANLAAMCETCNLGLGALSVSARTYARVVLGALVRAESRASRSSTTMDEPASGARSPDLVAQDDTTRA